jgi:hypothetical protein
MAPQKALETIGKNLSIQYERWQPKVREFLTLLSLNYSSIFIYVVHLLTGSLQGST